MNSQAITAEKQYIANRFKVNFDDLSASYLRVETVLGAQSTIDFNIQVQNGGTNIVSENKLEQTDQFIVTNIGFALKKVIANATDAQQAAARLYTWVNPAATIFDEANDANLWAIYNGYLEISLNRKTYVPAIDMRSFLRVPDAQQGLANAAIAGPIVYPFAADGFPNGLYGYFPVDYIRLNGFSLLTPTIVLPASVNMAGVADDNVAVLMFKGYLLSNGGNSNLV